MSNEIGYWTGVAADGTTTEPSDFNAHSHILAGDRYTAGSGEKIDKVRVSAFGFDGTSESRISLVRDSDNFVQYSFTVLTPPNGFVLDTIETVVDWALDSGEEYFFAVGDEAGNVVYAADDTTDSMELGSSYEQGDTYSPSGSFTAKEIHLAGDVVADSGGGIEILRRRIEGYQNVL